MTETTYTVTLVKEVIVWEFKYSLNGDLLSFKVLEGVLSNAHMIWMFTKGNFPATEAIITTNWSTKEYAKLFEVKKGDFDYTFDAWYNYFANKVGKLKQTKNAFNKLSKGEIILLWKGTHGYKKYLQYNQEQSVQYPSTFINQESYKNDWKV